MLFHYSQIKSVTVFPLLILAGDAISFFDCYEVLDSGGPYNSFVGNMGGGGAFTLLLPIVQVSGSYGIEICYAYGDDGIPNNLIGVKNLINGNKVTLPITSNSNWGDYSRTVTGNISLTAGVNALRIYRAGDQGFNTSHLILSLPT